ncbi:MAG TPA: helicase-associated domain-containing protein [Dictyobacter sp.]|jgi:hypothetical protein|nr:helicase-associated domain-containing protein [Dictyobacter sp.]
MEQSDLDLLRLVPVHHLQAIARTRHASNSAQAFLSGASSDNSSVAIPDAVIMEIARSIFAEDTIRDRLCELDDVAAAVLREFVYCGGRANSRDVALFLSYAGQLSNEPPGGAFERGEAEQSEISSTPIHYPNPHPHGIFEEAVRTLLLSGFLIWGRQTNFAGREYASGVHDGVLIVPASVRAVALLLWPQQQRISAATSDVTDGYETIDDAILSFQRDLYLYWSLVDAQNNGLSMVNNGLLARSSLHLVLEQFVDKARYERNEQIRIEIDIPRLLFVRLLLMQLGLLHARSNAIWSIPVVAQEFFSLPVVERAHRCYRLFLEKNFWNELSYLSDVNVRPGPNVLDGAHGEVVYARQQIVEQLDCSIYQQSWRLSSFIARMKLYVPYLLFPRQYGTRTERYSSGSNPYGWDFRLKRGWLTHREGWYMVEGGFIRSLLTGPLFWLGLVHMISAPAQPLEFRLSASAHLLLQEHPVIPVVETGKLIVQPNFELIALAPLSEGLLVALDRFAERASLEHAAQYRLTKASITRALQRGLNVQAILALLVCVSGGDVPQNVQYSLHEWERQARRIEIWPAVTLVEVDDSAVLDSWFADEKFAPFLRRRLTPTTVEIEQRHLETVQEKLSQLQLLPAFSTPARQCESMQQDRTYEPQWRLFADGRLEALYTVSDMYLVKELASFCEREADELRITTDSLQTALQKGMTFEQIIQFLQRYCVDGIPGAFLIRLKLWGGGYAAQSDVHVQRTPLLQLASDVLQDLQRDEEFVGLLGPEVGQQQRLIHVKEEHLSRVLSLLRQRGFTIDG